MDNGKSQGTLAEKGTLAIVQNNRIDPSMASIKESVALGNFDLAGAAPFLPASVRQLAGVANGSIDINVANGKSGTVGASIDVLKPTIELAAFQPGESLPLDRLSLSLPRPTTVDLSAGPEHWADWVFKAGDGRTQQIKLAADMDGAKLFNVTVTADVTAGELMDLAANRRPAGPAGATGRVEVTADADPGKLFRLLPKTLALRDGVELTSAPFKCTLTGDFSPASVALSSSLDLGEVKGRNTIEKRDLAIEPFHLSFKGKSLGGGWQMPDLRDLALTIQHGQGLSADFQGEALTSVNGKLHVTLRDIMGEAGQFIDLGERHADGDITLTAKAEGELLSGPATADNSRPAVNQLNVGLVTRDLLLQGIAGTAGAKLAQRFIGVEITGEIDRDRASGQVQSLKGLKFTARAGDEAQPNIVADLQATLVTFQNSLVTDPKTGRSSTVRTASIPEFKTDKLGIADLKLAQADFGGFVPFLKDIGIDHGSMSLAGTSGSYNGARHMLDFGIFPRLDELTAYKLPAAPATAPSAPAGRPSAPVQIVSNYSLVAAIGGKLSSDNGATRLTLSNLSITDSPQWLSITKTGDSSRDRGECGRHHVGKRRDQAVDGTRAVQRHRLEAGGNAGGGDGVGRPGIWSREAHTGAFGRHAGCRQQGQPAHAGPQRPGEGPGACCRDREVQPGRRSRQGQGDHRRRPCWHARPRWPAAVGPPAGPSTAHPRTAGHRRRQHHRPGGPADCHSGPGLPARRIRRGAGAFGRPRPGLQAVCFTGRQIALDQCGAVGRRQLAIPARSIRRSRRPAAGTDLSGRRLVPANAHDAERHDQAGRQRIAAGLHRSRHRSQDADLQREEGRCRE